MGYNCTGIGKDEKPSKEINELLEVVRPHSHRYTRQKLKTETK